MVDLSTPPPGGDVNRGPVILIVGWIECAVAFSFLCGRMYARLKIKRGFGADDWAMVVSFLLALLFVCIATPEVYYGTGRHVYYLSAHQRVMAVKLNWVTQAFHIMSTCFGKISIVILMLRIIGNSKRQAWFLYSIISALFVISVVCVAFIFAQCTPASALWDPAVVGKCWSPVVQQNYGYFTASYSSFTDFILALFPITVLWDLQMKLRVKVSLAIIMGLGIFASAASIIKTVQLKSLSSRGDYTFDTVDLIIWMMTEQFVIITAASVPPMRSLFVSFRDKPSHGSSSGRLGNRQPYGSNLSRSRKGYFPYDEDNDSHALQSISNPADLVGESGLSHATAYPEKALWEDSGSGLTGNHNPAREEKYITKTTKVEVTYNNS